MQSFKLLTLTHSLLLLCFMSYAWGGDGYKLPPLESDEQKLAFLLETKKHIPKLFSDAAKYDINLFNLLEDERKLVESLKTHPEYDRLFQEKHYFDLTVTPPREGIPVGSVQIKLEAIEAWKEKLHQIVGKVQEQGISDPDRLKVNRLNFTPSKIMYYAAQDFSLY